MENTPHAALYFLLLLFGSLSPTCPPDPSTLLPLPLPPPAQGPHATVYERGVFALAIAIPPRYPLEPPAVAFTTPIHHPNIDGAGRICLDTLSLPPKGAWRPALNLATVLASVRALLAAPNADDGLDPETAHQFRHDRAGFDARARAMTARFASGGGEGEGGLPGLAPGNGAGPATVGGGGAAGVGGPPPDGAGAAENRPPPPPVSAGKTAGLSPPPASSPPRPSRLQLGAKRPRADD